MYRSKKKTVLSALLVLIMVSQATCLPTFAQTLDGVIDEPSWTFWFEDNINPSYSAYYYENNNSIFIGIITNNTKIGSNQIQIAFKAAVKEYAILYSDISGSKFKPNTLNPETILNYWAATRLGLPAGVEIIQGVTKGTVSYEICIPKEILGKFSKDFPDKFNIWLMYTPEGSGGWIWSIIDIEGLVNFYPESRADWWFELINSDPEDSSINPDLEDGSINPDPEDEIPVFHAPETPYGTILSLFIMLGAFYTISKKNSPFSINI